DLNDQPLYEPTYFRQMGEPTVSNVANHNAFLGYAMLKPTVDQGTTQGSYVAQYGRSEVNALKRIQSINSDPLQNVQTERQPRNLFMQALTAKDASEVGLDMKIRYYQVGEYTPSGSVLFPTAEEDRVSDLRKPHHFSEIRVTSTEGTRYIYGIPAYNLKQKEVSFALGVGAGPAGDCSTGLATYSASDGDIIVGDNNKGRDNFVQEIETPAYAYSYLLTGIVSPDYVDLTGDGISDDDMGTAIRFDYTKAASNYAWRTPYSYYS